MDIMTTILATDLNLVGKLIYNSLFGWVKTWGNFELIGAFGITVIIFTIILKLVTMPFDVWQKNVTRKNAKKMDIMKPELDKATKQCGANRELLMQKQRVIYKEHGYSALSSCLPMIITLVIFFVIFSGFNSSVRHHNSLQFDILQQAYNTTYTKTLEELKISNPELTPVEHNLKSIEKAREAVLEAYKPERFLLTVNIFMADNWVNPIPTAEDYSGSGIGKLNIPDMDKNTYNDIMEPIMAKYNTRWNGYLLLPILSFILSILSSKFIKPPEQPQMAGQTEAQVKQQQSQAKMMTYMMPIMMGVFALFYSTAFTLYLLLNSAMTLIFNLLYNIISKRHDAKEKDYIMSTTIKK